MKTAPQIPFEEFAACNSTESRTDEFTVYHRQHPVWGIWQERALDLGHVRIYENKAKLNRSLNVTFNNTDSGKFVHHCISLDGKMGAHFPERSFDAELSTHSYHHLFLPFDTYTLSMDTSFTNIHIEIAREKYTELLSDCESWSAELKEKLHRHDTYYTGKVMLTPDMIRIIYSIFNSPLSGSLKKLLIEARIQELIALQLDRTVQPVQQKEGKCNRDFFYHIREYLDQTFLKEHSLNNLARNFGINEYALKKGFREHFQTTVFDYLLSKRMEHSYTLLQTGTKKIEEISSIVGYKYPNHFSTAFKKKFGVRPAQVR